MNSEPSYRLRSTETTRYTAPMHALALCVAIGAGLISLSSHAQTDPKLTREFAVCMDRAGAIDPEMRDCYSAEYKRQDKKLNDAYRALLGRLDPERKKELIEAQKLWLRYTEANCAFYWPKDGGTAERMAAQACAVYARRDRAIELESLAKW